MYADSHCHCTFLVKDFENVKNILKIANDNFISRILQVSVTNDDFDNSERLLYPAYIEGEKNGPLPELYFSYGISPNDCESAPAPLFASLFAPLLSEQHAPDFLQRIIAIGETGLDYYHLFSPPEKQKRYFELQCELAVALGLPIILHIRDAFDDAVAILSGFAPELDLIFHCYSGDRIVTERLLTLFPQAFFSFAGVLTFPKAEETRLSFGMIPLERLLLETDAPYLAPVPYRGKENRPEYIRATYAFAAKLRDKPENEFAAAVTGNFDSLVESTLKKRKGLWQ